MANMCSNTLDVSGDAESIKTLYNIIKYQDENFLKTFFFLTIGEYYGIVDDTLEDLVPESTFFSLSFTSKWSPPLEEIQALSILYPKLEFKTDWEESGCDIYGEATIQNGVSSITDKTPLEYYLNERVEMAEENDRINNSTPEELIAELMDNGLDGMTEDDHPMNLLQPALVAKIKNEDLPLIINMDWDYGVMESIKERLKHGTDSRELTEASTEHQSTAA